MINRHEYTIQSRIDFNATKIQIGETETTKLYGISKIKRDATSKDARDLSQKAIGCERFRDTLYAGSLAMTRLPISVSQSVSESASRVLTPVCHKIHFPASGRDEIRRNAEEGPPHEEIRVA